MSSAILRTVCATAVVLATGCSNLKNAWYIVSPKVVLPRESKLKVTLKDSDLTAPSNEQHFWKFEPDPQATTVAGIGEMQPTRTIQCRDPEPTFTSTATKDTNKITIRSDDEVICALKYAGNTRLKYEEIGKAYSSVPGLIGGALIPASASAIALTLVGTTSWPVTALGVSVASLLAFDKIYQNSDRETLYSSGAAAVQCVLDNIQPYSTISRADLEALQAELDADSADDPAPSQHTHCFYFMGSHGDRVFKCAGLAEAQLNLEAEIQTFNVRYGAGQIPSDCNRCVNDRKMVSSVLKAADTTDKAATQGLKDGHTFLQTANGLPQIVINQVHDININIGSALVQTETTIDALTAIVKGAVPSGASSLAGIQSASGAANTAATKVPSPAPSPSAVEVPKSSSQILNDATRALSSKEIAKYRPSDSASFEQYRTSVNNSLPPADKLPGSDRILSEFSSKPAQGEKYLSAVVKPYLLSHRSDLLAFAKDHKLKTTNTLVLKPQQRKCTDLDPDTFDQAMRVYDAVREVAWHLNRVASLSGASSNSFDSNKCLALSKKAAQYKIFTLNPSGDIIVTPGTKTTVNVLGATDAYVRPMFAQTTKTAVTGTLSQTKLDFAATAQAQAGFYPFFIGDGSTGKPLNIMVQGKQNGSFDVAACKQTPKTVCFKCPPSESNGTDPSTSDQSSSSPITFACAAAASCTDKDATTDDSGTE